MRRGDGDGTFHLRLGRNVTFEHDAYLRIWARGTNALEVGDNTLFQSGARFWLHSGTIRIGKSTILRDNACLKTSGDLRIGDHVRIGWCTSVHCHEEIRIDDYVGIADLIMIIDSDHGQDGSDTWWAKHPVRATPIHLKRNALISSNSVITRGARVGRNSVVAAGAVVRSGEYPDACVIGGVPAKPLRSLTDSDRQ
jgi:acetyltransferase-like isoleucine patch superfamily enzyme